MSNQREFNTDEVVRALQAAHQLAQDFNHEYTTLEHMLYVMLEEPDIQEIMTDLKVDYLRVQEMLTEFLDNGAYIPQMSTYDKQAGRKPQETDTLHNLLQQSVAQVIFSSRTEAKMRDLLLGMLQSSDSYAAQFLKEQGLDSLLLKQYLAHGKGALQQPGKTGGAQQHGPAGEPGAMPKDITSKEEATEFLARFTDNLNDTASKGKIDPVIGREEEVETIILYTARRTKNNVIMVGEPGVGKTAIAEGLALKIINKEVPESILDATVYSLNVPNLIAGTKYRGDFEDRMKLVLKALTFMDKPILFIDEIHMIMGAGAGSQGTMDVANMLKPALAKGELRCIGSTTFEEYRKHFEKDRALVRRFQKMDVNEPSIENCKLIMRGLRKMYEEHHGVTYTDEALDKAVELTARYVQNRFLPDKAIDVIDAAGARQRIKPADQKLTTIGSEQVQYEVSKIAKIPAENVNDDELTKLQKLDVDLKAVVFGQDTAIDVLVDSVMVARAGLREDNKPAGKFLFVGPTGVGKTEVAKQLASTLGVPLVRFDMSEYMEKHSVAKLIGAPPGYVGFGEGGSGGGMLTNEIEQKPHCVLLLDEIEKAHPDVFNILLQVLDDARLTNSNGKTVNFQNVTIIMSSNAGARDAAKNTVGFNGPATKVGAEDGVIKTMFAPEFLNRLDQIVKFKALAKENMLQVVGKFLRALVTQMGRKNLHLDVSPEAMSYLAEKGYDPTMGARPLDRLITQEIKKPLSRLIVFKKVNDGDTVRVSLNNGILIVEPAQTVAQAA